MCLRGDEPAELVRHGRQRGHRDLHRVAGPANRVVLAGPDRVEADLVEAIDRLADLRRRAAAVRVSGGRVYNPGWNLVFELRNMLMISEAIARSALQRTESRGAHSRLDFPATDDTTWGHLNSVVARGTDGTMTVTSAPLPTMADDLRGLLGGDH